MRLSEWRTTAPSENVLDDRVLDVLVPVLVDLGADPDPECWIVWGEDPDMRYSVLAPTVAGLISIGVRFNNAEEGPRAVAKLIRWSKLSVSELALESSGGHRVVAVQVESIVLKGTDDEADRICEFVRDLIAGVENRLQGPMPIVVDGAALGAAASARVPKAAKPVRPEVVKAAPRPPAPKPALLPAPAQEAKPAQPEAPAEAEAATAAPTPTPAAAAGAATPPAVPPTPIASRTAARQNPAAAATAPDAARVPGSDPEKEPDRTSWVGPHPIEEPQAPPVPQQKKPRPWMP